MQQTVCTHLDQIKIGPAEYADININQCDKCVKLGDTWVNLRMCMTCGNVGCCDSSKNKHATRHFKEMGHPIMQSVTPGEDFMYCYIDEAYLPPRDF